VKLIYYVYTGLFYLILHSSSSYMKQVDIAKRGFCCRVCICEINMPWFIFLYSEFRKLVRFLQYSYNIALHILDKLFYRIELGVQLY